MLYLIQSYIFEYETFLQNILSHKLQRMIKSGDWNNAYGQFMGNLGTRLRGKTLGVVGMGRIGQAIASRLNGFEIASPILYTSKRGPKDKEPLIQKLGAKYVAFDDLVGF